jgi:hypothetical protein
MQKGSSTPSIRGIEKEVLGSSVHQKSRLGIYVATIYCPFPGGFQEKTMVKFEKLLSKNRE